MSQKNQKPQPVKVALVGDSSVGKSSIVARIATSTFSDNTESTIGAAFRTFTPPGSKSPYHIWDTAGQERYNALIPMYLRNASIIFAVFDITRRDSFERVTKHWIPYIQKHVQENGSNIIVCIIGNKTDLEKRRQVPTVEAQSIATECNAVYIEFSAKTGAGTANVLEVFSRHQKECQSNTLDNTNVVTLGEESNNRSYIPSCCTGTGIAWWG